MSDEYTDQLVEALDHIVATCKRSNNKSRRLRWIEMRAETAINGEDWREKEVPKSSNLSIRERAMKRIIQKYVDKDFLEGDNSIENLLEWERKYESVQN